MDLSAFDIILLNTSAGKDSLAMMSHVVRMASRQDVFDRVVAVHADLGRCEWPGTKTLAADQCAHFGVVLHDVSKEKDLLEQVVTRGRWPDSKNRYCTSDQKRDQIAKVVTHLVNVFLSTHPEHVGRVRVLNCLGFRKEESPHRAKLPVLAPNARWTNKTKREVWDWLPIHEWTVAMVWWEIGGSGARYHYAYDLGMPRLSCVFCIFSPRFALRIAAKNNPKLLNQYVTVEGCIGHRFRNDMAIAEIAAEVAA